jgi:murein L,D-transpeptidase YcbB/YkuD
MKKILLALGFSALICLLPIENLSAQEISNRFIQNNLENLEQGKHLKLLGRSLFSSVLVPEFYQARNYQPAWISGNGDLQGAAKVIEAIASMADHGLQPDDYHFRNAKRAFSRLESAIAEGTAGPQAIAELDILLTDAMMMMVSHLYMGKVDPESIKAQWKIQRGRPDLDATSKIREGLERSKNALEILRDFYPSNPLYGYIMEALKYYRSLEKLPTFEAIKLKKSSIKPDEEDENIPAIRQRLVFLKMLEAGNTENQYLYDAALQAGIRRLQKLHGLNADAVIGKATLDALNMSIETRNTLLTINLERMRWMPWDIGEFYGWVNIADQRVYFKTRTDTLYAGRAIIGRDYRRTPVFEAKMDHIVFSPTWTVPPTILNNDVLPAVRKDIGYLASKNMRVLTMSGQQVDPKSIDWSKTGRGGFPYMIRQDPGPQNALGLVKFMFPNTYNVYMHDTPSKELFEKDDRALSSGCIRIENPKALAILLLKEQGWTEERITAAMNSGREQLVRLDKKLPVIITYMTAWADAKGEIHFRNDLYKRDAELIAALKGKPSI